MKILISTIVALLLSLAVFGQTEAEVISEKANLRGTPAQEGKIVSEVLQGEVFEVIRQKGSWFLVQTTEFVGWLHGNTIKLLKPSDRPATAARAIRSYGASSDAPVYSDPPTPPRRASPSYRTYIRGPRGGCYYINSNGNKTYVDRGMCN
jgi:hypothetical protein